tara:strand:- start:1214 stop:2473 length:1260 start_codon:yes stop_codon:yes gene_type:complete
MATDYNPDNTETDYIDDNAAESQYKEDTETHLRDVTKIIETDKSDEDTDTTKETNRTTTKKTEETTTKKPEEATKKTEEATAETSELKNVTSQYLNSSNMFVLIWFLAIYIVVYYVLGTFFNKGKTPDEFQTNLGRTLDFIFFVSLFIFILSYYTSKSQQQITEDMIVLYDNVLLFLENSNNLIALPLFIISLYIVVYLFRLPMSSSTKPFFISLIEGTAWISLLLNAIVVFMQKTFDINILDYLRTSQPEEEEETVKLPKCENEVFNVSNNKYSYEDAQAVCSSFGAKLANYDQIEAAYNKGAEWCNYGWSDGQMAFFPTQKGSWDKLQKFPKKKNNCGRPGVNGGYIDNPYIKFGVNCYGKKPTPTENDLKRLEAQQSQPIPLTAEDKELQEKIDYWKKNSDKLQLNSFNNSNWSRH